MATSWFAFDRDKKWGYVLFTNSEYGDELGEELLFYLFTGPDRTKLYWIIGVVLLIIISGFGYIVIRIIRNDKKRKTILNTLKKH